MHGGAVTLARRYLAHKFRPDVILATDMLDLTTFLSLTRHATKDIPTAIYFHENQLTYPWSPTDRDIQHNRDYHYGFINFASALAADRIFFNSKYHRNIFLKELPRFLKHFPDHREMHTVREIEEKSSVLHLGLDLQKFNQFKTEKKEQQGPVLLWNHRWEYDKNPGDFFRALYLLDEEGLQFQVILIGENFEQTPKEFENAKQRLGDKILHYGYVASFADYARWLWRADILPVTSYHDFFGASVVEAIYCGCTPLLPFRLAYPELLSASEENNYFYRDLPEFVEKLRTLILNFRDMKNPQLAARVRRFDWQEMIHIYDDELVKLISKSINPPPNL